MTPSRDPEGRSWGCSYGPTTLTSKDFRYLGFGVKGLGFRLQALGFKVSRVKGLGFRLQPLRFKVSRVWG